MNKKAEMGVGTLIIFIAMLLVAAVAAGVLIQTVGSLQEKALSTGAEAKGQVASSAEVVEISATDGRDTNIDYFEQIVKLAPGSNPIKISEVILTMNTYEKTATLTYRGTSGTTELNFSDGYNTRDYQELGLVNTTVQNLEEDLDEDGAQDTVQIGDYQTITFTFSTAGQINATIDSGLMNESGSDIAADNVAIQHSNGTVYGYLNISATTSVANEIPASGSFRVTPAEEGTGYFTVEYLQQGTNWVNGNLQRGDLIKIYYESPGSIGESEEVRVNFIPKIGTATLSQFVAPDVMSTERVYLYP